MQDKIGTKVRFSLVDETGEKICSIGPSVSQCIIKDARRAGITPDNFVNAVLAAHTVKNGIGTPADVGRMLPDRRTRAVFKTLLKRQHGRPGAPGTKHELARA